MRHGFSLLVTALMITAYPVTGNCWGPVGHRTIGLIAQDRLTPQASSAIQGLLGSDSLADVANWADQMRASGNYKQTTWYHFEKISDNVKYIENVRQMSDAQRRKGGVVEAILMAAAELRNPNATDRADALKFLVHFVGDIHQPLHTGRPEDMGGVTIDVNWMGTPSELHRVWDSGMIYSGHADILNPTEPVETASAAYAAYLKARPRSVDTTTDVDGWLNESMAIRPGAYDPAYNTDQKKYQAQHLPEVDGRIYAAGMRLADLLNHIFAGQPASNQEIQLRKEIEAITGDLGQLISFKK